MFKPLDDIATVIRNQKTYRVGLIQAKAYRFLKQHTSKILEKNKLSSIHWAMLGLLNDNKNGLRLSSIADELGVEPPFVTRMARELGDLKFLENTSDPDDSRAKLICLSKSGRKFVEETEKYMRKETRYLFADIPLKNVIAYIKVLEKIIENYKE